MTNSPDDYGLIIFVKNPVPGKTKTRLAKSLGDQAALWIYGQLIEVLKKNLSGCNLKVYVFYSDMVIEEDVWPFIRMEKNVQIGRDLGERMVNAIDYVLHFHSKVVLVGSDCPSLDKNLIMKGFNQLDFHDVVIGPSLDGGYYLIGMKQKMDFLFKTMPWSTSVVYDETLQKIKLYQLSVYVLPELQDVDEEEDFQTYVRRGILKPV
jgi:rSAM/selenodomain-associated transferase 1